MNIKGEGSVSSLTENMNRNRRKITHQQKDMGDITES